MWHSQQPWITFLWFNPSDIFVPLRSSSCDPCLCLIFPTKQHNGIQITNNAAGYLCATFSQVGEWCGGGWRASRSVVGRLQEQVTSVTWHNSSGCWTHAPSSKANGTLTLHWAHAHMHTLQHTPTHRHTPNTSPQWILCIIYLAPLGFNSLRTTLLHGVSIYFWWDFPFFFSPFLLDSWPTLYELPAATVWTWQTAEHQDHQLTENDLLIWTTECWY